MKPTMMILALASAFSAPYALAADEVEETQKEAQAEAQADHELNEVVVYGTFAQETGTQRITSKDIRNGVTGNGNISDLLKNNWGCTR
ncbi:uncharacterized protein YpmB [Neisseria perflava]|uniref:hypothetical protein n=1 Tax=Neisseria perflava TaxID=33053 RepID=UPI00209E4995|nr:hypothetical protein [Neisseria perflava]MCP1773046.1 uncharacterized protein YpmB [Neisseria perflava]